MVSRIAKLFRALFGKEKLDRELDDEICAYIASATEEKMAAGMNKHAARRAALAEAGGIESVKEKTRESRIGFTLDTVLQDIRFALRMLRKNPGFTVVAVLTLALGIGATTAMFSVVYGVLLRPLPFRDPDRLVRIYLSTEETPTRRNSLRVSDYLAFADKRSELSEVAGAANTTLLYLGGDEPRSVRTAKVSENFFSLLGISAARGRTFLPEEGAPGQEKVIVLGHALWQAAFGGDAGIIGQPVRFEQGSYIVVGVAPPGFDYAPPPWIFEGSAGFKAWIPLASELHNPEKYSSVQVLGRIKEGSTLAQASSELSALASAIAEKAGGSRDGLRFVAEPLQADQVKRIRRELLLLWGMTGFVLLLACANLASLYLVRSKVRTGETAIRRALGASDWRLLRQHVAETLVLALLATIVASGIAAAGVRILLALRPRSMAHLDLVRADPAVLFFLVAVTFLIGILLAMLPVRSAARVGIQQTLQSGARKESGGRGHHQLKLLVLVEVSLSLALLTGAGLMVRSYHALRSFETGLRIGADVYTLRVSLPRSRYPDPEQWLQFHDAFLERLRLLPGVQHAASASRLSLDTSPFHTRIFLEGGPDEGTNASYTSVSAGYFATLDIPIVEGRAASEREEGQPPPVHVTESLARRLWPDGGAVGRVVSVGKERTEYRIIGIVGNSLAAPLGSRVSDDTIYLPTGGQGSFGTIYLVRGNVPGLRVAIKNELWAVDPLLPAGSLITMADRYEQSFVKPRFFMTLLGAFAGMGVIMAAIGLYGVLSFAVGQRTHEIGVRMALGAQRGNVLRMVLRQGMTLTAIGIAAGLVASYWLTKYLKSFLFEVEPTDPFTFAAVAVLLGAVALAACWVPARRATRVDPMTALRYE